MNRIAIFQHDWPLQIHTINLVVKLAESDYFVDLFIKNCHYNFIGLDQLKNNKNVSIHDFSFDRVQTNKRGIIGRIIHRIIYLGYLFLDRTISKDDFIKSVNIIKNNHYKCFIGVEKKGLIWAGKVSAVQKVPYLYYNLELYIEDHPAFFNSSKFNKLRIKEKIYHKNAIATIIQDEMRGEVLIKSNNIEKTDMVYIHVALLEKVNKKKEVYLHDKFGISHDKKLMLYFGMVCEDRYSFKLAETLNYLNSDCIMVFHAHGKKRDINRLKKICGNKQIISLELVPAQSIKLIIGSASIGFAFYKNNCQNDRLTAFSSEKIALYLQSGVPIIAFDNDNYRKLMEIHHCGELINSFNELPYAIEKILKNPEYYRKNAFLAYDEFYNYEKQFINLKIYLDSMD